MSICLLRFTLYFNTCLLRKKLFQALAYMVLNYGWRKKECFSNELFFAHNFSWLTYVFKS